MKQEFVDMAGLQYYFFPTDFFYPKPPTINAESTNHQSQALLVKIPIEETKSDHGETKNASLHNNTHNYKHIKVPSLTTSLRILTHKKGQGMVETPSNDFMHAQDF